MLLLLYYYCYTAATAFINSYRGIYLYIPNIVLLHNNNNIIPMYICFWVNRCYRFLLAFFSLLYFSFRPSRSGLREVNIVRAGRDSGRRHDSFTKPVTSYPITSPTAALYCRRYSTLHEQEVDRYTQFYRSRPEDTIS